MQHLFRGDARLVAFVPEWDSDEGLFVAILRMGHALCRLRPSDRRSAISVKTRVQLAGWQRPLMVPVDPYDGPARLAAHWS